MDVDDRAPLAFGQPKRLDAVMCALVRYRMRFTKLKCPIRQEFGLKLQPQS